MIFANRTEAGRALAEQLVRQGIGAGGLVLALPRGGVPVAVPVAERLGAELDIVLARKIGAPRHPEFGVGAIAEDGPPVFDDAALRYLRLTPDDLAPIVAAERAELARRVERYRRHRPAPTVTGRLVILVDDGLATGVTAHAAVRWLARQSPRCLVLAVPVCSQEARTRLAAVAGTVVCLHAPPQFSAVGQWYDDFTQLTDAEVDTALSRHRDAPARHPRPVRRLGPAA
ncbi:phosphoribosyltransferase [Dactylosporangium matsuzakiense]|uniref:Phosphoribosyltransferase n=1 Tax=Dactylosporangium matsuzakiense TaxID=53360 RepID=A0A9W6KQ58_9ACTN|nr:phosphoribosyltransferase family protein [Dactylosporangium matsuzakiense]UWZ40892.1 phosphoribosyltransferase [Dactylosporangium matsuzakiense]GLL03504.1 phosphoribosyltransferase [Dactylosporangium matsuzakiense]